MKKKSWLCLVLVVVLSLGSMLNASAMGVESMATEPWDNPVGYEDGIMPLWDYTDDISLILSFTGSTAHCSLMVIGYSNASSIKVSMWLLEPKGSTTWSLVKEWRDMTSSGRAFSTSKDYSPVVKGQTYKLYFTGYVYGPDGVSYDFVNGESIVTY